MLTSNCLVLLCLRCSPIISSVETLPERRSDTLLLAKKNQGLTGRHVVSKSMGHLSLRSHASTVNHRNEKTKWRRMAHSQLPPEEVKKCSVQHQVHTPRYCPWFELDLYLVIIMQPTRWWHFKMNANWMGIHMKMIYGLSLCLLPGKTVKKKKRHQGSPFRVAQSDHFSIQERPNKATEWCHCREVSEGSVENTSYIHTQVNSLLHIIHTCIYTHIHRYTHNIHMFTHIHICINTSHVHTHHKHLHIHAYT